ncbi:hypothetical protein Tco_0199008, partial [Tanacetum coccineum]
MFEEFRERLQAANISTHTPEPLRRFNSFYDDNNYEKSTIHLNEIVSQIPPSIAITSVLSTLEPEDSLIMGDEELSTILEKESDEVIKSCSLRPGFQSQIMLKFTRTLIFEFDDEYISSDVNPLFDEVLENIESKGSYVSNLDEPALLVTPLSDANEDEYFDPGGDVDEIQFLLHRDPSTPKISVASILKGFTDEPPLEENDDLFDLESKENEWKKILNDAPIDDLMTKDKIPSGESMEHIEVLSVLWGNRLPIPEAEIRLLDHGRLAYRCDSRLKCGGMNKNKNCGLIKFVVSGRFAADVAADMYGYCKNHKKTVKIRQTRTRERIECTRAGSLLAK